MNKIFTIYVEKKSEFNKDAQELLKEFKNLLSIKSIKRIRQINKYDICGITSEELEAIKYTVLSEKNTDNIYEEDIDLQGSKYFVVEYHEGQYDQRADSAAQCIQLITQKEVPQVKTAKVIALYGDVTEEEFKTIKSYYINSVDSKESSLKKKEIIMETQQLPSDVEIIDGFINMKEDELKDFLKERGLSLNIVDIVLIRNYFKKENRNPTITEIKVLDTYWSDHCRHTTFQRVLTDINFEEGKYIKPVKKGFEVYEDYRRKVYEDREKPITLMDMAVIAMESFKS